MLKLFSQIAAIEARKKAKADAKAAKAKAKEDAKMAKMQQKQAAKLAKKKEKETAKLAKKHAKIDGAVVASSVATETSEEIESVTMMGFSVEWAKFALTQTNVRYDYLVFVFFK